MTRYTDQVLSALTGLLDSRAEWDEAPGLYFLYAEDGTLRLSANSILPDGVWTGVPTYALAAIADEFGEHAGLLAAVAPPGLLGTVFRCEMWGVAVPAASEELEEAKAMHRARQLEHHPDRTEQRHAWAVLRDGGTYVAVQPRGGEATARRAAGVSGLIPGSLARITRAICAEVN